MAFRSTRGAVLAAFLIFAPGCASLQSVSVTAVPDDRTREVSADEDNVAFLGIHFSNSFADELRDRLKRQCPGGRVTGIFTKYETFWYVLVQRRKVSATGYCVREARRSTAAGRSRTSEPARRTALATLSREGEP